MQPFPQIAQIEERRRSRVIVFGATNLDPDLLAPLYETLRDIGPVERLDVVLYCRGGYVNAARRMALLFHEFTDRLGIFVPHYCESSGTILTLAAHEIIAGPLAIFSPIDPQLAASGPVADGAPMAVSSEDVRLFTQMGRDWFGLKEQGDQAQSLSVLCENIFPTTLTSFYRSILELRDIGDELLALHMADSTRDLRSQIVDRLISGYHSHSYALTPDQMKGLGLPVGRDEILEDSVWAIARNLGSRLGAGVRTSHEEGWTDAVVATSEETKLRCRSQSSPAAEWKFPE